MNSPLQQFDNTEQALAAPERKKAEVVPFNQAIGHALEAQPEPLPSVPMNGGKHTTSTRDSRWFDYLIIGLLSIFIHHTVVNYFDRSKLQKEEKIEPVKKPSKVKITFVQPPPPKPVVQEPPPPPKVVALKPPPKPKVKPKPAPKPKVQQLPPVQQTPTVAEPDAIKVPAPPAPPAPVEEKVTPPSSGADYLNNPQPNYPEEAQDKGWEGKVVMKVHVQANGHPDSVTVIKSSGHDVLDDEAVRTVKEWEFAPAKRGDTPIAGVVTVPISFNLAN